MTIRTTPATLPDTPAIPVQARLAAAWTSFMFLYVYVDILNFYKPGVVDGILDGLVWRFDISSTLPDDSGIGAIFRGLLGYNADPTWLEVVAWLGYLVVIGALYLRPVSSVARRPVTADQGTAS